MRKSIPLIALLSLNLWSQPIIKAPIPIKGEKFVELDGIKISDYYNPHFEITKIGDDHFIVLSTSVDLHPELTERNFDEQVKKFGTKVGDRILIWKNKDKIISINKKALPWQNFLNSYRGDQLNDIKKTKDGLMISMNTYEGICTFDFFFVHKNSDYILKSQNAECWGGVEYRHASGYISDSAKQNILSKNVSIKNFNPDNFIDITKKLNIDEVNLKVDKAYFYSTPNEKSKTKAYLISDTDNVSHVKKVFKDKNGQTWYFVRFVTHRSTEKETKGWLRGKDVSYQKWDHKVSFFRKDW
jgi:hypothetical protein